MKRKRGNGGKRGIKAALAIAIIAGVVASAIFWRIITPLRDPIRRKRATEGMVYVPPGIFLMGSTEKEIKRTFQECLKQFGEGCTWKWFPAYGPQKRVFLDGFYIDKTETTQEAYQSVMGNNPSYFKECGANCPVEQVSWDDAKRYCRKVGKRLPTEAEWEKAARGTDGRIYPWGNEFDGSKANYCDKNCDSRHKDENADDGYATMAPVGRFSAGASPYGALDMLGNVEEWVADCYDPNWYEKMPKNNPVNMAGWRCEFLVSRGDGWRGSPSHMRVDFRGAGDHRGDKDCGFRCARDL